MVFMSKEMVPQNNLPEKKPEGGLYYEYTDPSFLEMIRRAEAKLPDDPKALLEIRDKFSAMDDAIAEQLGADIWRINGNGPFGEIYEVVNRMPNEEKRKKAIEIRHLMIDVVHAVNRKLNKLGYDEE